MAEAKEVCRAFRNTGRCRYGDECNYEHSEGDPIEPPPRGQCFNWKQTGECDYGDNCRFLHGDDDDGSRFKKKERKPREPAAEGGGGEGGDKPKKKRKPRVRNKPTEKLDEVCNNYLEGRCRYGEQCRRQHVGDVPQKVEKIDEVCRNFLEGRCRFGELCRRQHPADQAPAVTAE